VTGVDGKSELVNYRPRGRYYVVDTLFAAAELRLGGKHQKIVRIRKESAGRRQQRPA
jgi:type IV secretion system protein TrbG